MSAHTPAARYEAFEPEEARRLVGGFEWHYTPKHGSWLNMAEAELAILAGQCLDQRIVDQKRIHLVAVSDCNARYKPEEVADHVLRSFASCGGCLTPGCCRDKVL